MLLLCSTREILKETLAADEEYHRDKWTLFGNEAEKVELDVIRNQHVLRTGVDKIALRKQVEFLVSGITHYSADFYSIFAGFNKALTLLTGLESITDRLQHKKITFLYLKKKTKKKNYFFLLGNSKLALPHFNFFFHKSS